MERNEKEARIFQKCPLFLKTRIAAPQTEMAKMTVVSSSIAMCFSRYKIKMID